MKQFRQFREKPIYDDLEQFQVKDMDKTMKGLLGNYLLRQISPESLDIDLFENMLKFKPNKNFELGVQQKGKNNLLNLNWRF